MFGAELRLVFLVLSTEAKIFTGNCIEQHQITSSFSSSDIDYNYVASLLEGMIREKIYLLSVNFHQQRKTLDITKLTYFNIQKALFSRRGKNYIFGNFLTLGLPEGVLSNRPCPCVCLSACVSFFFFLIKLIPSTNTEKKTPSLAF